MTRLERLRAPCEWGPRGRGALGVATAWPPVYVVLFIGFIVASFFLQKKTSEGPLEDAFAVVVVLHMLTFGLSLVLLGAYVFDIFRNPRIKGDMRVLWVAVVVFANALAMPVYRALYLRPRLPTVPPP